MTNQFDVFISQYNASHEEKMMATEILRYRKMNNQDSKYYFDFDCGYSVISSDFEVLSIENVDPQFENEIFNHDEIFYQGGAFYYSDGKGTFEFVIEDNTNIGSSDTEHDELSLASVTAYDGQLEDGDGKIYDIAAYVADRYPDYQYNKSRIITNYRYIYQYDTSFYLHSGSSEGNCVINSTYSMLLNTGMNGYCSKFYSNDYYMDCRYTNPIANDVHYSITNNGWNINERVRIGSDRNGYNALENIPHLYYQLRERAIASYGYDENSGMKGTYIPNMIADIDGYYGYTTSYSNTSDRNTVLDLIDDGIPSVVLTSNSETYGNHAMAVKGYYVISKDESFWLFNIVKYIYFYCVDDGHTYKLTKSACKGKNIFYDGSASGSHTFVCADKSTLCFLIL